MKTQFWKLILNMQLSKLLQKDDVPPSRRLAVLFIFQHRNHPRARSMKPQGRSWAISLSPPVVPSWQQTFLDTNSQLGCLSTGKGSPSPNRSLG